MKRTLVFVVLIGAAVAALGVVFKGLDEQIRRLKFENARYVLKQKFMARLPHITVVDDEKAAPDLVRAVRLYGEELSALYKIHPQFQDVDSILKKYEAEYKEGKKDEAKMRGVRERIAMVKAVWGSLVGGTYKPFSTAHDKTIRVDINKIEKRAEQGQDKLFVHTLIMGGIPDKAGMVFGAIDMNIPLEDDEVTKKARARKELQDMKAQRKATVNGRGEPNTLINEPDKWVEDFPPGLMIGFYDFPLFPGEAKNVELVLGFDIRNAGGGMVTNEIKFKPIIPQPEWKLPVGASYDADTE